MEEKGKISCHTMIACKQAHGLGITAANERTTTIKSALFGA